MTATGQLIKFTIKTYKENFRNLQEVLFLFLAATFGYQLFNLAFLQEAESMHLAGFVVSVSYFFLSFWVEVILVSLIYLLIKRMPYKKELVYKISLIVLSRYIWVKLIYYALIYSGALLFVIPGIVVFILFSWAPILVALEGRKVFQSFNDSLVIVAKHWRVYLKQWILASGYFLLIGLAVLYLALFLIGTYIKDLDAVFNNPLKGWPLLVISIVSILLLPCFLIIKIRILEDLKLVKAKELGADNKEIVQKITDSPK